MDGKEIELLCLAVKERSPADHWLKDLPRQLPISWGCLRPDPLHKLLNHSDGDGKLAAEDCDAIADSLERLLPLLPQNDGVVRDGFYPQSIAVIENKKSTRLLSGTSTPCASRAAATQGN
jgi:hypothetical protein